MAKAADKDFPRVTVRWVDSACRVAWRDLEELEEDKPTTCETMGWLVKEEKEYVIVAASRDDVNDRWADSTSIPRGCVLGIQALSLGRKKGA